MYNKSNRPITTPEEVYQFIQDSNEERRREIWYEDAIDQISRGHSLLN